MSLMQEMEAMNSSKMEEESPSIFILSGQSNMSGRGGVKTTTHNHHKEKHWDGVIPTECHSHPTIFRLSAHHHWELAKEPLHRDIDSKKVCGIGPGMPFANALRSYTSEEIRLVPCAIGGTKIDEWKRGGKLYDSMVERAREAKKKGGVIRAMLWYHGESDSETIEDAEGYGAKLERMIGDLRRDLGCPSLPIVQVALASGDRYVEKVREAQLGFDFPNVGCVDAKGLTLKSDNLHLTTKAHVKLGRMIADFYWAHFRCELK